MSTLLAASGLALTALATGAAHYPLKGISFRDRLRPQETGPTLGLRLTPGCGNQLTGAELVNIVRDSPRPISAVGIYSLTFEPTSALLREGRRVSARFTDKNRPWVHLAVTAPDSVQPFLQHRLGLLGIRSRPLTPEELAATVLHDAHVVLRRPHGRPHAHKPYMWFSTAKSAAINQPAEQVLGIDASGAAVHLPMTDIGVQDMSRSGLEYVTNLIIGALALGYRIGVRTHRPHAWVHLLNEGLVRDLDNIDILVEDSANFTDTTTLLTTSNGSSMNFFPRIIRLHGSDSDSMRRANTQLLLEEHLWTLRSGCRSRVVKPVQY